MLHTLKKLERCDILSTDGPIGTIDNVYFDDRRWVVRYLIVKTGTWLNRKKVLISPYAVQLIDWPSHSVMLRLTKAQIEASPDIDTDKPVSRQQEEQLHSYYGYPAYWPYTTNWPAGLIPAVAPLPAGAAELPLPQAAAESAAGAAGDAHLRSGNEVIGYTIVAQAELMGHVEDFLFDDETWALRYLIAKTRNWLPGKHVLLEPPQIKEVDWSLRTVSVALTRSEIEQQPEFDPDLPPAGDREKLLVAAAAAVQRSG